MTRRFDTTRVFVHADARGFASERERLLVCACPFWRTFVGAGAASSHQILETTPFLDAAVVFTDHDPDGSWPLVWRFLELHPRRPVIAVSPAGNPDNHLRAQSRGATIWTRAGFAEHMHYILKHRLHFGVYHRVFNLSLDHPRMTTREYQCVLLVTAGMDHKEVAARLGIETSSVRGYLRSAAHQVAGGSVQRLIATLQAEAFEESRKMQPHSTTT